MFTLGLVFLYSLLGWSSLVGLAVMLALIPVPAKLGILVRGVQKERMAAVMRRSHANTLTCSRPGRQTQESKQSPKVGSRNTYILAFTADAIPVMSLLRMIKQFGYEQAVEEQIAEKRDAELKWIWKRKLLGVGTDIVTAMYGLAAARGLICLRRFSVSPFFISWSRMQSL
jgi:hypothetical protein